MLNILIPEPEPYQDSMKIIEEIGNVVSKSMSREELLNVIENFDILLVGVRVNVDKEILERGKRLKIIGSNTTGTDHIDIDLAKRKGIKVITLSGETELLKNVNATVELTFTLMLGLIRKLPWAFNSTRKEEWDRYKFVGHELNGKTLGIIGFGRIGSKVSEIAKAFKMKVMAYDPYVDRKIMENAGVTSTSLENLLRESDIISIHCSLTNETENMINYDQFKLMKNNAILINTARGKIVSEEALLYALKNKLIAGAALDVIENEVSMKNPLSDNPLAEYVKKNDNLIITPHIGGATRESMKITSEYIVKKIKEIMKENP